MKLLGKTLGSIALIGTLAFPSLAQGSLPVANADTPTAGTNALDQILDRLQSIERRLASIEGLEGGASASTAQPTTPVSTAVAVPPVTQTDLPSVRDIAARIEAVDEQVRIVDRKREIDLEAATTRLNAAPVVSAGADGFSLRSADSAFQFKIAGYFQSDGRFFAGPGQVDTSTFVLRRVRPVVTGTLFRNVDFRVMPDWGGGTASLQDLHLDFKFFPKASVRFGKFKAPFSLERLQSATDLTFIERAYPTNLAPNRDLGVQVYGDFGAGTFTYAIAAMNGVPDGGSSDIDTNDGKDIVGRVFFQPFIRKGVTHKGSGLGFGVAASKGRQTGTTLSTYRTTPQSAFFTFVTGTTADGDRRRLGPQAYYYVGPFGVIAEYTITEQDVRRGNSTAVIHNEGWQVAASYFLTGERKGYRSPVPRKTFDRATGGKGAIELTGRYTQMNIDGDAFLLAFADPTRSARKAQEWTGGIAWYVTRGNKFVINYSHTNFTGGSAAGNRIDEKAILSRFQVAF